MALMVIYNSTLLIISYLSLVLWSPQQGSRFVQNGSCNFNDDWCGYSSQSDGNFSWMQSKGSDYTFSVPMRIRGPDVLGGLQSGDCTFDEPDVCGYTADSEEGSGFAWRRTRVPKPSRATGPSGGHGGRRGRGYFIHTEGSLGKVGDRASLRFSTFKVAANRSLQFYYSMNGPDIDRLLVSVQNRCQWLERGHWGDRWQLGCVNLPADVDITVTFTAVRGRGPLSDIGIDDVGIRSERCPVRSVDCGFEDPLVCGYINGSTRITGWNRASVGTYGIPSRDHRSRKTGYFAFLRGVGTPQALWSPWSESNASCLRFYYLVRGMGSCRLQLNLSTANHIRTVWKAPVDGIRAWKPAQVYVSATYIRLAFEGYAATENPTGCLIALDDVALLSKCCPSIGKIF